MTLKFFRALADLIKLPPSFADWIPSVAPAFSALLCAPLGFSRPHIRAFKVIFQGLFFLILGMFLGFFGGLKTFSEQKRDMGQEFQVTIFRVSNPTMATNNIEDYR